MANKYSSVILVLGMPGSGKTTAGIKLAYYLNLPFRSVGDVLRRGKNKGLITSGIDLATSFYF